MAELMRRRDFTVLAGAAALGAASGALAQAPMPTIGFLGATAQAPFAPFVAAFHKGINEEGFLEGRNLRTEYRWADGSYERLQALAPDLVNRKVSVIVAAGGIVAAQAAKALTSEIPILFVAGIDPVKVGLVTSINRPGGNATGVSLYTSELMKKRLELLLRLAPQSKAVALLVNPAAAVTKFEIEDLKAAISGTGLKFVLLEAKAESEFDAAFETARQETAALLVSADPFFNSRRVQIVVLAAKHQIPASYPLREFVEAGGLMSYGPSIGWAYQQIGRYAGRLLKGVKAGDLPVQLPTTFELMVNLNTSKAFGLKVPDEILALADRVIE